VTDARSAIYYWKCDRPAAMHGVGREEERKDARTLLPELQRLLSDQFDVRGLRPAGGKGNHHTYLLNLPGRQAFVRVEDGPEQDGHLAMESQVIAAVADVQVPVPEVLFTDASRKKAKFAVQVIEYFDCPDLNAFLRDETLDLASIATEIGRNIRRWQKAPVRGFGPFDPVATASSGVLTGYHQRYETYFRLHLERHLEVLTGHSFLSDGEAGDILRAIADHTALLEVDHGCLVHKDLALWNILGTSDSLRAFIDWDDAVAGDPSDDLSLLGCFHSTDIVQAAINGYAETSSLPPNFLGRFWLHLLRNMLVKSVIRCEAGYFALGAQGAFLMSAGQDGTAFKDFTRNRLFCAYRGLVENLPLATLDQC
jgi:aminoglycoside phosphotransferase (APT) family kinase protein